MFEKARQAETASHIFDWYRRLDCAVRSRAPEPLRAQGHAVRQSVVPELTPIAAIKLNERLSLLCTLGILSSLQSRGIGFCSSHEHPCDRGRRFPPRRGGGPASTFAMRGGVSRNRRVRRRVSDLSLFVEVVSKSREGSNGAVPASVVATRCYRCGSCRVWLASSLAGEPRPVESSAGSRPRSHAAREHGRRCAGRRRNSDADRAKVRRRADAPRAKARASCCSKLIHNPSQAPTSGSAGPADRSRYGYF
jgi:hypothetical protein